MEGCQNSQNTYQFFLEKKKKLRFRCWSGFNEIGKNSHAGIFEKLYIFLFFIFFKKKEEYF
jgi:hypothetical protein